MRIATTQEELDEWTKNGEWVAVESGSFIAHGSSHVDAWDSSHVDAWDSSRVDAWGSSHVDAHDSSHVVAWGSSHVDAHDSSHVVAWGSSYVVAHDSSHVVAWGKSICLKRDQSVEAEGNVYDHTQYPKTVRAWLRKYNIKIRNGKVILYKGTDEYFGTRDGIAYLPGTDTEAPDWKDDDDIECGNGLHFCPRPSACDQFRAEIRHYVACEVNIADLQIYKHLPDYPDKIRGRKCRNLYEVTRDGKRIGDEA